MTKYEMRVDFKEQMEILPLCQVNVPNNYKTKTPTERELQVQPTRNLSCITIIRNLEIKETQNLCFYILFKVNRNKII